MKTRLGLVGLLVALGVMGPARCAEPPPDLSTPEGLARTLRGYIVQSLPPVLYEDSHNWGQQKLVTRGIEWKGAGNPLPKAQKSHKNHGVWRRTHVTPVTPAATLDLQIHDMKRVDPTRLSFTAVLAMDLRFEAERQRWRAGVRTWSGSYRARTRVYLTLACELTSRLESSGGVLPDLVFRFRVLRSDVRYDHFVTEHVVGVGGELAEWIGDAGHNLLKAVRPSLERNLLEKANAAIVRAADTKEVRVSLGKWFPSGN
jgi:hypothetical protein